MSTTPSVEPPPSVEPVETPRTETRFRQAQPAVSSVETSPSIELVETAGDRPPATHLDAVRDRELPRFAEALRRLGR